MAADPFIELLNKWAAEDNDYDEKVWPELKKAIEGELIQKEGLMTKPDTKEINDLRAYYQRMADRIADVEGEQANQDFQRIFDAYDEAQKEIERLNTLIKFQGEISVEKTQRISTLEGLLREVSDINTRTSDILCLSCGTGECKPDCLFTRIQKELGEV